MNPLLGGLLGGLGGGSLGALGSRANVPAYGPPVTLGEVATGLGGLMSTDPWQQLGAEGALSAKARIPSDAVWFAENPMERQVGMRDNRGFLERLLGDIGDTLAAPRRALWSALGGPESGAELVSNLTGLDRNSALASILGLTAEMVGDPLSWAGAAGGLVGSRLGTLMGRGASRATRLGDILAHEGRGVQSLRSALAAGEEAAAMAPRPAGFLAPPTVFGGGSAPTVIGNAPAITAEAVAPSIAQTSAVAPATAAGAIAEAATPSLGGLNAEHLAAMFGRPVDIGPLSGAAKTYQRVNPNIAPLLSELGMMEGAGVFPAGLPNWAAMRGGRVVPAPGYEDIMPHLADLAGIGGGGAGHLARMRSIERMKMLTGPQSPITWSANPLLPPMPLEESGAAQLERLAALRNRLLNLP